MSHKPRRSIATLATACGHAGEQAITPAAAEKPQLATAYTLPSDRAYPESITVDAKTGATYVSSYLTGEVFRAAPNTDAAEIFLPAGAEGRNTANGVKVDPAGRLWVIDSTKGVAVYDTSTRALLAQFAATGTDRFFVNDLVFTPDGTAYLTDSVRPVLYRVTPAQFDTARANGGHGDLIAAFDLGSALAPHAPDAYNLNGVVADAAGRYLLVVDMTGGDLYRVSLAPGDNAPIRRVTLRGDDLKGTDGMELRGETLWAAQNSANAISRWHIGDDGASATEEQRFTDPGLAIPTSLVHRGDELLVAASQFDKGGPFGPGTPNRPFRVLKVSGI
ncbi:superoxide dismutase [Nocardia panacis]|uniref:Superoxide dismutase n=1 Tax=Nocardia panacis TaxID=2340916 RepID=A0A3A4L2Q2_9NOCA|nr:SMP-30/gluconolactonase/LRE family protein [Nocardia panacis]RJO76653.1 superoxide dismutase [Nocardia panacis]